MASRHGNTSSGGAILASSPLLPRSELWKPANVLVIAVRCILAHPFDLDGKACAHLRTIARQEEYRIILDTLAQVALNGGHAPSISNLPEPIAVYLHSLVLDMCELQNALSVSRHLRDMMIIIQILTMSRIS